MTRLIDITGQRFERLVVIGRATLTASSSNWRCQCDCDAQVIVRSWALRNGKTLSCGCYHHDLVSTLPITHGDTRSKEWCTWIDMIRRCTDSKRDDWKNYGGRGIRVHKKWLRDYSAFLKHVGRAPSPKHTIDRIDNNGHYEPGNVRWATRAQQARNKRAYRSSR